MFRYLMPILLILILCASAFAATTVVVNGKAVSVPVIEANGKAYVDVVALVKLLGGTASFDAAAHKVVVSSGGQAAASAGTAQLAGDNGELGKVYSLVKSSPLYFSLKSAEFTTAQVKIGDEFIFPTADEKLLVLHFTIQNPQKGERFVRGDYLKMTAIDAMNVNHEAEASWGDAQTHNTVALTLKPAQNIEVYGVVRVPAKGLVPKLMVMPPSEDDGPVLRYDLRDKVAPLQPPIADPSDPTGSTALTKVPAQVNTVYPYEKFNMTVEKFEYTTDALGEEAPGEGERYLVATLLIVNAFPGDTFLRSDYITPVVTSTDGQELGYKDMLFATSNQKVAQDVKAGQQLRVRIYFTVPKASTPQTLDLKEGDSRTYEFAIK